MNYLRTEFKLLFYILNMIKNSNYQLKEAIHNLSIKLKLFLIIYFLNLL